MDKLKFYFHKYESHLSSATLVFGFIFDFFTLQRVDYLGDNIFVISYLLVAGTSIIVINLYEDGKLQNKFFGAIHEFLPFVLQFAFGGLFSAFVIFYSQSASFVSSGVFILILVTLLVGNEFFKKRYEKLVFQTGVYFIALFSFFIYFLPVLLKKMGAWVFLGSGAISLFLIRIFILFIARYSPRRYKESYQILFATILSLFILINFLYFTNIIPPIPLSLKSADVYHLVTKKSDGNYEAVGEATSWMDKFRFNKKLHLESGDPAYVFGSVFAPTDLNTTIVHDWQYFSETSNKWVSVSKISFPIRGGRGEGYRAFSKKSNVFPGKWRVDIKTERGQVVGRVRFIVERMDSKNITLETKSI